MSKTEVVARCRQILYRSSGRRVLTGTEREFVETVLSWHPDAARWPAAQGGITEIAVGRWAGEFHTPCFYVHYENGEVWDFSFHKCVRAATRDQVEDLLTRITASQSGIG